MSLAALTTRNAVILALTVAMAAIATAWGFELAGYKPCPLCLKQRWPYYFSMPVLALMAALMVVHRDDTSTVRLGLVVVGVVMLAGAATGVYHSGIEWGFWEGPASCAGGAGLTGVLPDLDARVVRCDEAPWRFAGLSFAGWNVVMSLLVAALALAGARGDYGSSSVSQ